MFPIAELDFGQYIVSCWLGMKDKVKPDSANINFDLLCTHKVAI